MKIRQERSQRAPKGIGPARERRCSAQNMLLRDQQGGLAEGKHLTLVGEIKRLLTRRFGGVPESLAARLQAIADPKRLQEIFDAAIDATSVSQLEEAIAGG